MAFVFVPAPSVKGEKRGFHNLSVGTSDFQYVPVYPTKWPKFGLRALGLDDPCHQGQLLVPVLVGVQGQARRQRCRGQRPLPLPRLGPRPFSWRQERSHQQSRLSPDVGDARQPGGLCGAARHRSGVRGPPHQRPAHLARRRGVSLPPARVPAQPTTTRHGAAGTTEGPVAGH